jgi:hypothetical protein
MLITSPVRKALLSDKAEVLEICKQDHSENGQFSLSVTKLEDSVNRVLDRNEGVIGVIQRQQQIESIIMLRISQFWYSEDWLLEEYLNYVRPQFRRSTNAKDMINFAKRCSDEIKLPLVIGVVANERTKPKLELYKRQLGEPVGGYFIHWPHGIAPAQLAASARIA